MKSRTGGIIGTIVSALLCGVPGLVLACVGLMAVVGGQSPQIAADTAKSQNAMLGGVGFLVAGGLLILVPLIVAFFTVWRRRAQSPATPVAARPAVTPEPPQPHIAPPLTAPPAAPVMAAAVAQPMPAAAPASAAPAGLDPSARTVYDRLMALNRPTAPYQIIDGRPQNVDLIAEWKIVDARWYEVFAKASLTKVFQIQMKLDPARREVRAQDRELTVSWKAGVPSLSFEASFFKGQKSSISFGTGYAFTETLAPGQVYKYKFNTNELKKPIQEAIAAAGWTYKGVAFGKL